MTATAKANAIVQRMHELLAHMQGLNMTVHEMKTLADEKYTELEDNGSINEFAAWVLVVAALNE